MAFPHAPVKICETTTAAQTKPPTANRTKLTIRLAVKIMPEMPCACLKFNFSIFKITKNYTWRPFFVGPLVFAKRLPEGECFAPYKLKKARNRRSTTSRRRKALKFAPARTHEHFRARGWSPAAIFYEIPNFPNFY